MPEDPSSADPEIAISGMELAAQLLTAPSAFAQVTPQEAQRVVAFMLPAFYARGTCFIEEGDEADTGFMALVLQGDVIVENVTVSRDKPVTTAVLGPGCLVGEMGLLDSGPRSASCTASTAVYCAVLPRDALYTPIAKEPALGAKLLLGIAIRVTARPPDTARKLKVYASLCQSMDLEMNSQLMQIERLLD